MHKLIEYAEAHGNTQTWPWLGSLCFGALYLWEKQAGSTVTYITFVLSSDLKHLRYIKPVLFRDTVYLETVCVCVCVHTHMHKHTNYLLLRLM